jgi:hypothetical protein
VRFISTILFLLICLIARAQSDSLEVKNKMDSLLANTKVDSLLSKFTLPDSLSRSFSKLDSSLQKATSSLQRLNDVVNRPADQINQSVGKLNTLPSSQIDKSENLIQNTIRSHQPKIKGLDSVRNQVDSMKTKLHHMQSDISKINTPQWVKSGEKKKIEVEAAVNEKLNVFKEKGATGLPDGLHIPGSTTISQRKLPRMDNNALTLPNVDIQKSATKIPSLETPSLDGIEDKIKKPALKMPKLEGTKGLNQIGNVQEKLGNITSATGKASSYQEDLKNLGSGNFEKMKDLPDELESRVEKLDEMQALEGQAGAYKEMIAKWNSDPDVQKEAALNLAKEQAMNHFAGKEEQLKAAMEQLAKLKAKTKGAEGVVDLFKKHQNTMKQKTFPERLVPGIVFQVQKPNNVWIDFNPSLGYRFYGRLTAGLGWNERWSVSLKERRSYSTEHIYGPRSFIEFKWKDYLFLKAETEWMNILPISIYPAYIVDASGRRWVWSSFAGIKNVFTFSKAVKGQVQVLYNLYNPDKLSPYSNRLNVRFGFEFPMKTRIKIKQ